MSNYNNYDFNSDNEIPLEVLRARYLGKGASAGNRSRAAGRPANAITERTRRIIDAVIMVATLFICLTAIFGMAETFDGEAVTGYDLIYFGDVNMVDTVIEIFSGGIETVDFYTVAASILAIILFLSLLCAVLVLFFASVFTVFTCISHFVKKESCELERGLVQILQKAIMIYLPVAYLNEGADTGAEIIGMFSINTTFTLSVFVGAAVVLGVAIARAVIRRRRGAGAGDGFLKLHITSYLVNLAILAVIASRAMFNFIFTTFVRFVEFIGNIPDAFENTQYLIGSLVGVAFFAMGAVLVSKVNKGIYRDGLRLITSGEALDAKTKSELLNEDFNKKPFKSFAICAALAYFATIIPSDTGIVTEIFSSYRNMYLFIALISLAGMILTNIFKKAKK